MRFLAICLGLLMLAPINAVAQRGGSVPEGVVRKMEYTDPTGALSREAFRVESDALRKFEQIIVGQAQIDALPFPATKMVKKPNGFTQQQTTLVADVELDGSVYELRSYVYRPGGLAFKQFRPKVKDLRPFTDAFHAAFRADPTFKMTIRHEDTGQSVVIYNGTLKGEEANGGRGGR